MKHLKELRTKHGYTQNEIAKILGISRAAYTNIENGKREPDFDTLNKLSNIFNVSSDYLIGRNSAGWDQLHFPPYGSDTYNSICTVLLNAAQIFDRSDIVAELQGVAPTCERLVEIAKICRYDAESFGRLISNCAEKNLHSEYNSTPLSRQLRALIDAYNSLNEEGQQKLLGYAVDLVATGHYEKEDSEKMA